MTAFLLIVGWLAAAVSLLVVIRHHVAYFRRTRPFSFGAFLETGGWIILLLAALGALGGGLAASGTQIVEVVAGVMGLFFIGIGSSVR